VNITQHVVNVNSTEVLRLAVECVRDFISLRLGARMWDLRQEGCEIEERRVEGTAYGEYRLRPARKMELPPAFVEVVLPEKQFRAAEKAIRENTQRLF
jgi:hypothetical protein